MMHHCILFSFLQLIVACMFILMRPAVYYDRRTNTVALSSIIISHSLLWRHIVLLTVGVYSSNYRVLYTIGINMTRRFQKSVGLSVCPFVTLTKKTYSSFIIDSRKIIFISGERVWHPLQEYVAIFSKYYFSKKNLDRIFEKLGTCIKIPASLSLLIVE